MCSGLWLHVVRWKFMNSLPPSSEPKNKLAFCLLGFLGPDERIPTAVNLGFLDRSRYFSIQVVPQLYSRGWVDPVPDPLLLRKSGIAGNRTRNLWICSQELWRLDHRGCPLGEYEMHNLRSVEERSKGNDTDCKRWNNWGNNDLHTTMMMHNESFHSIAVYGLCADQSGRAV
jgi:hypothetical protein